MILKLNFNNIIKPVKRLIVVVAFVFIANYVYVKKIDEGDIQLLAVMFCILVLPSMYLFVEYLIATVGKTVEITEDHIKISYKNGNENYYKINDLAVLKLYKSKGMEKGGIPFQTAELFYHVEIYTKDCKKIILTSFLGPNFDEALNKLNGIDKKIHRRLYSTIYIPSLWKS